MKTYRKILFGVLTFILVFSLGACKSAQKRNTNVPLGNLNTSSVIARSNDASLSLGDYYDTLRLSTNWKKFFSKKTTAKLPPKSI